MCIGDDYVSDSINVIVPAAITSGTQTYTLEQRINVTDDDINEVEQSFALVAEIGADVPADCFVEDIGQTECSCFQTQVGEIECFGRSGATEIRIIDNDRKFGSYKLLYTLTSFCLSYDHWIH